jgi:hypothetical protein
MHKWTLFIFCCSSTLFQVMAYLYGTSRSHSHTPHSVGLLWASDQSDAETCTWQHTSLRRYIYLCPPDGIRTQNPSKRAATDPHLRRRGHWDRHIESYFKQYLRLTNVTMTHGHHHSSPHSSPDVSTYQYEVNETHTTCCLRDFGTKIKYTSQISSACRQKPMCVLQKELYHGPHNWCIGTNFSWATLKMVWAGIVQSV